MAGKTFIYGNLEPAKSDGVNVYLSGDNRPQFLSAIGMTLAPVVDGEGRQGVLPPVVRREGKRARLAGLRHLGAGRPSHAVQADPLMGQIPAVKKGALVADSDQTLTLSISASSPLSLPWALDAFLPQLAEAADKSQRSHTWP